MISGMGELSLLNNHHCWSVFIFVTLAKMCLSQHFAITFSQVQCPPHSDVSADISPAVIETDHQMKHNVTIL